MSSTYYEHMGPDGYAVRIQYCERILADGTVCNRYLGANYPSGFCTDHRHPQ